MTFNANDSSNLFISKNINAWKYVEPEMTVTYFVSVHHLIGLFPLDLILQNGVVLALFNRAGCFNS